jgi:DNA-binding NarL/FixJ family response regulator
LAQLIAKSKYNHRQAKNRVEFGEKEIEIIILICKEFTNKEIADQLFLSVRTVEGYRQKLQEKMQVKNSIGIVIYAIQNGIFDPAKH